MRRVAGPFLMALACGPEPSDESAGSTSAVTSFGEIGEAASAPTTTGGETFVGCDVLLRGDVDDTAAVQAALDGASDGATVCFEGFSSSARSTWPTRPG
ncbi:hypothetical protein OV079_40015 [Nannocystis pusilla]|uniref:Uncharacterized protein n=1 Tax=Nannocystis pusilla TaxID=889268 RepID=A0A9X3F554_9BACT|nr:hypothetical protein [Nannocystis pusilla]MCY1011646.1 hypothetical protein [Nannocystis pusilla]